MRNKNRTSNQHRTKVLFKNVLQKAKRFPHLRAQIIIVVLLLITGVLSFSLFDPFPAIAAILASISAGCITGIVFYILTNIRNNELLSTKEEFDSLDACWKKSKNIKRQCAEILQEKIYPQEIVDNIVRESKSLAVQMSTMCFDLPRATKVIADYPHEYLELSRKATEAVEKIEDGKIISDELLFDIMVWCSKTEDIIIPAWIALMKDTAYLENSKV